MNLIEEVASKFKIFEVIHLVINVWRDRSTKVLVILYLRNLTHTLVYIVRLHVIFQ